MVHSNPVCFPSYATCPGLGALLHISSLGAQADRSAIILSIAQTIGRKRVPDDMVLIMRCSGPEVMHTHTPSGPNPLASNCHFGSSHKGAWEMQSYSVPGIEENWKYLENSINDSSKPERNKLFSERQGRDWILGPRLEYGIMRLFHDCALKGSLLVVPWARFILCCLTQKFRGTRISQVLWVIP